MQVKQWRKLAYKALFPPASVKGASPRPRWSKAESRVAWRKSKKFSGGILLIGRYGWSLSNCFYISSSHSDATALMRHPCLMAGSPGPPVRTLLYYIWSNKKVYHPALNDNPNSPGELFLTLVISSAAKTCSWKCFIFHFFYFPSSYPKANQAQFTLRPLFSASFSCQSNPAHTSDARCRIK